MAKEMNYHDELNKKNVLKLREILETLPPSAGSFSEGSRIPRQPGHALPTPMM